MPLGVYNESMGTDRVHHVGLRALVLGVAMAAISCTPQDAANAVAGRGTVEFASACEGGPTKAAFTAREPVVMRVRLPTKLGVQNVTEILVQNSGGTKSVLDTMTTQVSPSWTTYCKPLPVLAMVLASAFQGILSNPVGLKAGALDLQVEVYTGNDLRGTGDVRITYDLGR